MRRHSTRHVTNFHGARHHGPFALSVRLSLDNKPETAGVSHTRGSFSVREESQVDRLVRRTVGEKAALEVE